MTDEQATPAPFFHPLFAGMVPSLIDAPCASTFQRIAQGLGFMSVCEQIPHGLDAFPEAVQRYIDDGYQLAARWPVIRADVLLYLKPTKAFAQVIWLAGLGVIEQQKSREQAWAHNAAEEDFFRGHHATREQAIADGQEVAAESGRLQFETKLFTTPLAGRFANASCLLEHMYCQAQDAAGEAADDFPSYGERDEAALDLVVGVLVDGWAVATGNQPTFSADGEQAQTHDVIDLRNLAP